MRPILYVLPGLGWEVASYGACLALGLLFAWVFALRRARVAGLPPEVMSGIYIGSMVAGLFLARAVGWVKGASQTAGASFAQLDPTGLSLGAGLLAVVGVGAVSCQRRRLKAAVWLDVLCAPIALLAGFERLGAFLAGADFGRLAGQVPWGVRFPEASPAFAYHLRAMPELLPPGSLESLPVHPVQLYGAFVAWLAIPLAWALTKRRRFSGQVAGVTAAVSLVMVACGVAPWRAEPEGPLGIDVGLLAAAALLGGAVFLRARRARKHPEASR